MTTEHLLISAWSWNPWLIAVCAAAILTYIVWHRSRPYREIGWLLAGVMLLFLTLASPIDALADGYLFSAHMLQHLLLLLIVPPLILLGLPLAQVPGRLRLGRWRWVAWILRHPIATWSLGVGGMWIWHAPTLCNVAVTNYISLLSMGFAFWWPITGPWRKDRLSAPAGIIYLFSACVGCTILGIIIAFAPVEVCSIYLHPIDRLGILPLIHNQWGLTPAKDQQLGGLLMWVPACLIYSCGILGLLARWFGDAGDETVVAKSQSTNTLPETAYVH